MQQFSIRSSELERAVHIERDNFLKEVARNSQETRQNEKRINERTNDLLAKKMSRKNREATEDLEQFWSQQEQALETFDTRLFVMMKRCTQAIMPRLNGVLNAGNRP